MFLTEVLGIIITFLINTLLLLIFILVGGVLPLYERKFLSLTQRRVGPKYVGYKGRLQFIADAVKLLFKNYVILFNVNKIEFILLPIVFLNINLYLWLNIIWFNNISLVQLEFNIIFFILIGIVSHIIMFLVGIVVKNKYTIIASSRIINTVFIAEIFTTIIISFILFNNNSFSLNNTITIQNSNIGFYYYIPIIPFLIFLFLLDNGKSPFDQVEAETEVIMGYHVEYSGFWFGLFVLTEYLHLFFFTYLIIVLCLIL